jgi:hypothetical protein
MPEVTEVSQAHTTIAEDLDNLFPIEAGRRQKVRLTL